MASICPEIATLAAKPQKGVRRKEKYTYGDYDELEGEFDVVDVFIPFQGSADCFQIIYPSIEDIVIPLRMGEGMPIITFRL